MKCSEFIKKYIHDSWNSAYYYYFCFPDVTWMTWRTLFPLCWLACSTLWLDLSFQLLCFTSDSLLAVVSSTPSPTLVLCLSPAGVAPGSWACWSLSLWLTVCLVQYSYFRDDNWSPSHIKQSIHIHSFVFYCHFYTLCFEIHSFFSYF